MQVFVEIEVSSNSDSQRHLGETVTEFWGYAKGLGVLVHQGVDGTAQPNLSVCSEDACEGNDQGQKQFFHFFVILIKHLVN